jgi:hypothetical protein
LWPAVLSHVHVHVLPVHGVNAHIHVHFYVHVRVASSRIEKLGIFCILHIRTFLKEPINAKNATFFQNYKRKTVLLNVKNSSGTSLKEDRSNYVTFNPCLNSLDIPFNTSVVEPELFLPDLVFLWIFRIRSGLLREKKF